MKSTLERELKAHEVAESASGRFQFVVTVFAAVSMRVCACVIEDFMQQRSQYCRKQAW